MIKKALLAFDNSGEYSYRRAEVNDMLKKFSNDTGPDPIIYLGEKQRADIKVICAGFLLDEQRSAGMKSPRMVGMGVTFSADRSENIESG